MIPTKSTNKNSPQQPESAANCRVFSRGQEALLLSSCKRMIKGKKSLYILFVFLASSLGVCLISAQYEEQKGGYSGSSSYGGGHGGGGGYGGGGSSDGEGYEVMDERPKLKLGIRLKIPAFKFELPRFSLPKITVSAKIRQPSGPRVIQLPEINFDTSSKTELPNKGYGGGGGYAGGGGYGGEGGESQYSAPSYRGAGGSAENTFEFSTQDDNSSSGHGQRNSYQQQAPQQAYNNNQQQQPSMRSPMSYLQWKQQKQQYHGQSIGGSGGYNSLNSRPSFQAYNKPPGAQQTYQYKEASRANAEEGFNSPVYMGLQRTVRS